MSQVIMSLEVLWAFRRVSEDPFLSPDEKRVINKELFNSLPHPIHSTNCLGTRDIVANHLSAQPSIKLDEEVIVTTQVGRGTDKTVPKEYNKAKEKDRTQGSQKPGVRPSHQAKHT